MTNPTSELEQPQRSPMSGRAEVPWSAVLTLLAAGGVIVVWAANWGRYGGGELAVVLTLGIPLLLVAAAAARIVFKPLRMITRRRRHRAATDQRSQALTSRMSGPGRQRPDHHHGRPHRPGR